MQRLALLVAIVATVATGVAPAEAQLARTYVSSLGNDANDCNRLTPCRTFQGAHDKTLANGEITVLDPGGYGAVTITKAISIVNDGAGEAGILVSGGGTAITINAAASDPVSIRGLTIKGIGFGGGNGVVFNSGLSLSIENSVVRGVTGNGIHFRSSTNSSLSVTNTLVADNGNNGIRVNQFDPGAVTATFNRVQAYNNVAGGISVTGFDGNGGGRITATATDCIAVGNGPHGEAGFQATSTGGPSTFMVVRSLAANNGTGMKADAASGAATLWVSQSTLTGNVTSWSTSGTGVLRSYGNNNIDGNGDGNPATPPIPTK